jgi:hypothetical protein
VAQRNSLGPRTNEIYEDELASSSYHQRLNDEGSLPRDCGLRSTVEEAEDESDIEGVSEASFDKGAFELTY